MTQVMSTCFEPNPSVVPRKVAGEIILVPVSGRIEQPCLYTLDETAAFLWERLDGAHTGETLAQELQANFAVEKEQAEADTQAFLEQLQTIGAIRPKEPKVGQA